MALALLLLHEPDGVPSVSGILEPTQTEEEPDIDAGLAFTVTGMVALQPVPVMEYFIVATPAVTPVTMPLDEPTVAAPDSELHVPPGVVSVSVVVAPWHTTGVPPTAAGVVFTVTAFVEKQPALME
jgi:hypothetical protein